MPDESALTDDEILEPGPLDFPNGGKINVHRLFDGKVYFARQMPGSDEWDYIRMSRARFVRGVRRAGGCRARTPADA